MLDLSLAFVLPSARSRNNFRELSVSTVDRALVVSPLISDARFFWVWYDVLEGGVAVAIAEYFF